MLFFKNRPMDRNMLAHILARQIDRLDGTDQNGLTSWNLQLNLSLELSKWGGTRKSTRPTTCLSWVGLKFFYKF